MGGVLIDGEGSDAPNQYSSGKLYHGVAGLGQGFWWHLFMKKKVLPTVEILNRCRWGYILETQEMDYSMGAL